MQQAIRTLTLRRFKKPKLPKLSIGKVGALFIIGGLTIYMNSFMIARFPFFQALFFSFLYSAMPTIIGGLEMKFVKPRVSQKRMFYIILLSMMAYGLFTGRNITPFLEEVIRISIHLPSSADIIMDVWTGGSFIAAGMWVTQPSNPAAAE